MMLRAPGLETATVRAIGMAEPPTAAAMKAGAMHAPVPAILTVPIAALVIADAALIPTPVMLPSVMTVPVAALWAAAGPDAPVAETVTVPATDCVADAAAPVAVPPTATTPTAAIVDLAIEAPAAETATDPLAAETLVGATDAAEPVTGNSAPVVEPTPAVVAADDVLAADP
jgi:hypothetical protein